jgi:hypothetical protein
VSPPSMLRALLRRMIVDADCEQEVANAVAKHCGWIMGEAENRRRLMQCLRGHANRHFEADWLPIVLRIVVAHGGADLITGQLHQAVSDGAREREAREVALKRSRA